MGHFYRLHCASIIVFKQAQLTFMNMNIHLYMPICTHKPIQKMTAALVISTESCPHVFSEVHVWSAEILSACSALVVFDQVANVCDLSDLEQWPLTSQENKSYKDWRLSCGTFAQYLSVKPRILITNHHWITRHEIKLLIGWVLFTKQLKAQLL